MLLDVVNDAFSMLRITGLWTSKFAALMTATMLIGVFALLPPHQADAVRYCITEHVHMSKYKHYHYDYCKPGQPTVPKSLDKPCQTEHIHKLGHAFELHYHPEDPCIKYSNIYDGGFVDVVTIKFAPQSITQLNYCSGGAECTNLGLNAAGIVIPAVGGTLIILKFKQDITQANFCDDGASCKNASANLLSISGGDDKFLIIRVGQTISQLNLCSSTAQCTNLGANAVGIVVTGSGDLLKVIADQDITQVNVCNDANCLNGAVNIVNS